jgi:multiple sugar transport system substrate-binding protein
LTWLAGRAWADDLVFLSTQLRPIEEAQKVREVILKGAPAPVTYVTEDPPALPVRIKAEQQGGKHTISLIGALHGELQPLLTLDALTPLDDLAATLKGRGVPDDVMKLGQLGTGHQMYIPWMQATYIMVANKQALPFLPAGADINALTYDQLRAWGTAIQEKTGKRLVGFPAGPKGLMHRFFEVFLYPSHTGGVVVPFRSPEAEAMWSGVRRVGEDGDAELDQLHFMQDPLLAATCGSPSTTSPGCSMRCARSRTTSSRSLRRPGRRGAATCRCWPASR